jgi:hypothetical protein
LSHPNPAPDPDSPRHRPPASSASQPSPVPKPKHHRLRTLLRILGWTLLGLIVLVIIARPFMPTAVRWYVNRVLDQSVLYKGRIGDIQLHLWRGAYSIHDIRISKTTGNIPVPFFASPRVDLAIQWSALLHHKIVGQVLLQDPELNFVDDPLAANSVSGAGGPWLKMLSDLFPFQINSATVDNGSIHFRTYKSEKPVDIYLSNLHAEVDDLTNVDNSVTPMLSTVKATALAMDQAKLEFLMKLNPFAYSPTFHLGVRLLGLDLTKIDDLTQAYANFTIKRGLLDLVVEIDSNEGEMTGYIKPLFRNMVIFDLLKDIKQENVIQVFWEAIVGTVAAVVTNYNRGQLGTVIPFTGQTENPQPDYLATIGNLLRNAFIRAYLPRMQQNDQRIDGLEFQPPTIMDSTSVGDVP